VTQSRIQGANRPFAVYVGLFVITWAVYVLLFYRHVQAFGEDSLSCAATNIAVRLTVWVLPVFLMLRVVDRSEPLRALGLIDNWKRGAIVGFGLSAFLLAIALLRFGWPHDIGRYVTWNSILSTSFGIGLFEEIPFRGFILQKLQTRMNFWLANGLTSLVFVSLQDGSCCICSRRHWPSTSSSSALSGGWCFGIQARYGAASSATAPTISFRLCCFMGGDQRIQ
jgi:membrane protease YdiL (CAAX protease family)